MAPGLPHDMVAFLAAGGAAIAAARHAESAASGRLALADVRLRAPVVRPPKFLAIGLNYADHVKESGLEPPAVPVFFNKQATCVAGPFDPIHLPRVSPLLDYEGELAFVIGRRCRHVPRDRAHEVIAGYLVVNDVSVRDWQLRTPTMTMGKSFDTHGPMGPWLVTPDEIGDPHALELRTWVNGELRQHSNTRHLMYDCSAMKLVGPMSRRPPSPAGHPPYSAPALPASRTARKAGGDAPRGYDSRRTRRSARSRTA